MKNCYVKTLLCAYPHFNKIIKRMDTFVGKKVLSSMSNFTSCVTQCEEIISLTMQKCIMIEAKYYLEKVIKRLTKEEKDLLDYKYFKLKPQQDFAGVDLSSRNYYRKQQRLIEDIGKYFDWMGKGNEWFDKSLLKVPFMEKLLFSVQINDDISLKNPRSKGVRKKLKVA